VDYYARPFLYSFGNKEGYIDLGAERLLIGAKKGNEKIAVEVKSFIGKSDLDDFKEALGQFLIYLLALEEKELDRILYLAIPSDFYYRFLEDPFFARLLTHYKINILIFNIDQIIVEQWILK